MEEERYQKELFEFEEPKKPFPKLSSMLPKADFEGKVAFNLTLDKVVFVSIGIIMAMILVFAVGVESGKRRSLQRLPAQKQNLQTEARKASVARVIPALAVKQIQSAPTAGAAQNRFLSTAPAVQPKPQVAAKKPSAADLSKPYTIVAGSFSKRETAQSAVAYLSKEGYRAFSYYNEPYYMVSVGSYADPSSADAKMDLLKVRRIYKDAFIRLR